MIIFAEIKMSLKLRNLCVFVIVLIFILNIELINKHLEYKYL